MEDHHICALPYKVCAFNKYFVDEETKTTAPDHTVSRMMESRFKLRSLPPDHVLSTQSRFAQMNVLRRQGPLGHYIVKTDTQLS